MYLTKRQKEKFEAAGFTVHNGVYPLVRAACLRAYDNGDDVFVWGDDEMIVDDISRHDAVLQSQCREALLASVRRLREEWHEVVSCHVS